MMIFGVYWYKGQMWTKKRSVRWWDATKTNGLLCQDGAWLRDGLKLKGGTEAQYMYEIMVVT